MNSEKQNIALIIPGGIGTGNINIGVPVLERIINMLATQYNVTVFQLYNRNDGYEVSRFTLVDVYSKNPIVKFIRCLIEIRRHHRQKKFTVIHGFWILPCGFIALLFCKLYRIKSVVSVLGGDAIYLPEIRYGQLKNSFYKLLSKMVITRADVVISLTQYLVDNLEKAGIKRSDIKVIPWGVDTKLFSYQPKKINGQIRFLHIGNLHPVKDQMTLLKAFKIINDNCDAHLTIIGEGQLEDTLKSYVDAEELQDKVSYVPLQPYDLLPNYYHQADVLLHTSVSEGQSEVVTEAMSSGVVVCGTKVGLLYDHPELCISVPVKDHLGLAENTLAILNDLEQLKTLQSKAYQWASFHSIEWTVNELQKIYDQE